ncbi:hypothetical protein J7E24_17330, partial [Hymenobacter sp. ISL-91]|uniref:hypothetical protein n=1 Tax=Hymenobacter sp. ISL-91 TaxID=2819151 RepID=UPI001BE93F5D
MICQPINQEIFCVSLNGRSGNRAAVFSLFAMPSNIRATLASALLLGLFSAVFLLVQYKFPVSLAYPHQWGHSRPVVPDSVAQKLIRQLIAQADSGGPPRPGAEATGKESVRLDFRISRVLLEHWPISTFLKMKDAEVRYQYGQESVSAMRQLYAEKMLSAADTAFMHQQLLHSTGFRLEEQYLPGCTVIPVDTLTRLSSHAKVIVYCLPTLVKTSSSRWSSVW